MVTAVDVCLYGLKIIMPLMSVELLKFPSLCLQYFKTTTFICELFPEKIAGLDAELQKNLIASLEIGLTGNVGADTVFVLCCDFLQVMAAFMFRTKTGTELPLFQALRPFVKVITAFIVL